jgi:hypothetical protein
LQKIVSKSFLKNRQKSQTDFSSIFLVRFWAFLGEGSAKTRQKTSKKTNQPWYFFGLRGTNQPRRGPPVGFFLECPLVAAAGCLSLSCLLAAAAALELVRLHAHAQRTAAVIRKIAL